MNLYQNEQLIIKWLKEYDYLKASIEYLNESIEDIAESGMGLAYDKDQISKTNKFSSVVENAAIQIDKLDITNKIKTMTNIVHAVDVAFEVLNETEKTIIISRCVKGQYYYQFCYKIHCSERTTKRIRKDALRKMSLVLFGEI